MLKFQKYFANRRRYFWIWYLGRYSFSFEISFLDFCFCFCFCFKRRMKKSERKMPPCSEQAFKRPKQMTGHKLKNVGRHFSRKITLEFSPKNVKETFFMRQSNTVHIQFGSKKIKKIGQVKMIEKRMIKKESDELSKIVMNDRIPTPEVQGLVKWFKGPRRVRVW